MTVLVSKPALNIREELSSLKKPSGLFGEQILRTNSAAEFYNLVGNNKNVLINGDFRVSQRGTYTTATATTTGSYYLDRWKHNISGGVTITHNLNQTLPNGNIVNTVRLTQTSTGYSSLDQFVEDYATVSNKPITTSFWAKANIPAAYSIYNGTIQVYPQWNLIPDGQWHFYTWTTIVPLGSTFRPEIWSANATTAAGAYYEVANFQVEVGAVATPFERRPIQQELALCQRYYQKYVTSSNNEGWNVMLNYSGVDLYGSFIFPVTMRTTPGFGYSSNSDFTVLIGGGSRALSAMSCNQLTNQAAGLYCSVTSSFTAGQAGQLRGSASGGFFYFNAEY